MAHDDAETDAVGRALARVAPALDDFLGFAGPERARERSSWQPRLDRALPEHGLGAAAVLDLLADVVVPHGLPLGAPGFVGWVATGAATVPAVAQLCGALAAPSRWWTSPAGFLEQHALDWLRQLVGLPAGVAGAFVSGGALGNLVALAAARQRAGHRLGFDAAADGCAGFARPRVYASAAVHQVVERAVATLGLGRAALVRAATHRGRLDLADLERRLDADRAAGAHAIAIVASLGDVSAGAIDPLPELAALARAHDLWLHVDGAYGGLAALDPRVAPRLGDLAAVDSFVVDPHKWLAVPTGCGAVFVRDRAALEAALDLGRSPYLEHVRRPDGDPASAFDHLGDGRPDHTLEHSAPARGLQVWAALAELGRAGVAARVARHLDCARRVAERVRAEPALELVAEPELSIACFRVRPPGLRDEATVEALNRQIAARLRARGAAIPSLTRIDNKLALRACFLGPRTGLAEADLVVDEALAALAESS